MLSVSNGHNLSNVRRPTAESIEDFRRVVALCHGAAKSAKINCGLATSFGCTIEGDVDEDRVRRIAGEVAAAGADGIILADTVGYGQPAAIERVFRKVIADVAPLPVAAHFHDTRGLGIANVLAAYNAGCRGVRRAARWAWRLPPTRRAPPATSSWRTPRSSSSRWAARPGSDLDRLVEVRAIVARALPDIMLYGAIAKAGLPRNFHPVAQAAE